MLLSQHILFLLLILICELTINTNQNDLSLFTDNHKQRIKRFLSRKSFKSKSNSQTRSNNNRAEDILLNNRVHVQNDQEKQSPKQTNKGFTQQELTEINRILSKNENDYYGILNINKHATPDKIKNAYRRLSSRVHPDKINAPGATEATQKLNKARAELLKKFENQNQNTNQQKTNIFTTHSSAFNENKNREATDDIDKSDSISPFSPSVSDQKQQTSTTNSFFNKSTYLIIGSIIFIIGIIIFIIFYKKRQRQSSTDRKVSKKQNKHPTYDTPESNDGDVISMNTDSETSNGEDDE